MVMNRKHSEWAVHLGSRHFPFPVVTASFVATQKGFHISHLVKGIQFNSEIMRKDIPVVLGPLHFHFHLYQSPPSRHGCPLCRGRLTEPPAHSSCLCQVLESLTRPLPVQKKKQHLSLMVFAYPRRWEDKVTWSLLSGM